MSMKIEYKNLWNTYKNFRVKIIVLNTLERKKAIKSTI